MSFSNRARLGSPSERAAALREQAERDHKFAQQRRQEMAGREKSPTGVVRGRYQFDEARSAVGSLNRKIDEAIDEVSAAFRREAQLSEGEAAQRATDAQRAPVLGNRRAVS